MSEVATTEQRRAVPAARNFRNLVTNIATSLLSDWVGDERAGEATGRVACALSSAAQSARNPKDFYDCTPESVGAVVAMAALTGIMPSTGANALAYAIPRRARKGEAPQLRYQLSHRGVCALVRRTGQWCGAIPISHTDKIRVDEDGSVEVLDRDIDNPPETEAELRGIIVIVKELATGIVTFRGWVPLKLILRRREQSDAYQYGKGNSPWDKWFVEQCQKTAIHYAAARGWIVIDDTNATRALAMDVEHDRPTILEPAEPPRRIENQLDALTAELEAKRNGAANADTEPDTEPNNDAQAEQPADEPAPESDTPQGPSIIDDFQIRLDSIDTVEEADALLETFKGYTDDAETTKKLAHMHSLSVRAIKKRK